MLNRIYHILVLMYAVTGSSFLGPVSNRLPTKLLFVKLAWRVSGMLIVISFVFPIIHILGRQMNYNKPKND